MRTAGQMTPGPWRVRKDWIEGSPRMAIVASFAGKNQGHRPYPRDIARMVDWSEAWDTIEEMDANARAIAALPDLVEALQEIERATEDGPLWYIARAALAKLDAEGGAA